MMTRFYSAMTKLLSGRVQGSPRQCHKAVYRFDGERQTGWLE